MAIVKVKLILNEETNVIRTELDDDDNKMFNRVDVEVLGLLEPRQKQAEANREEKKKKNLIPAKQFVSATDYTVEPDYAHAGIHLHSGDEIEWFSDQDINFVIRVGIDPQLYFAAEDLQPSQPLTKALLAESKHNPFQNSFPLICVNGDPKRSGPPKAVGGMLDPQVAAQRYYKFSVNVLGTNINLDPHIEIHDDF